MEVSMELERIRKPQGNFTTQENYEFEYDTTELIGPSDAATTSTGSFMNTTMFSSWNVQPFLFQKSI